MICSCVHLQPLYSLFTNVYVTGHVYLIYPFTVYTFKDLLLFFSDVPLDDPLEAGSDCEPEPAVLKKDSLSSVNETGMVLLIKTGFF